MNRVSGDRAQTFQELERRGLLAKGLVSFNNLRPGNSTCTDQDLLDYGDPYNNLTNSLEQSIIDSNISVVLETVVDERIHLTEKVLRPIACGHPFMLAAGPGSLKLLRKYGFKTFSPFINESYDTINDKTERLTAVAKEMQRLSQLPNDKIKCILDNCQLIAKHNRRHFFSKEFYNAVIKELDTNVNAAYNTFRGQLDFEAWWKERKWHHATQHRAFKQFEKEHDFGKLLVPIHRRRRAGLQP
jgi:hypothetical protein